VSKLPNITQHVNATSWEAENVDEVRGLPQREIPILKRKEKKLNSL
jgi:hypothetical protein